MVDIRGGQQCTGGHSHAAQQAVPGRHLLLDDTSGQRGGQAASQGQQQALLGCRPRALPPLVLETHIAPEGSAQQHRHQQKGSYVTLRHRVPRRFQHFADLAEIHLADAELFELVVEQRFRRTRRIGGRGHATPFVAQGNHRCARRDVRVILVHMYPVHLQTPTHQTEGRGNDLFQWAGAQQALYGFGQSLQAGGREGSVVVGQRTFGHRLCLHRIHISSPAPPA